MTDYNIQIAAAGDDGYAQTSGSSFNNSNDYCTFGNQSGILYRAFFRFQNVQLPKDAIVSSAILRFRSYSTGPNTTHRTNIRIEADDDPTVPSSGANLVGRSLGSSFAWDGEQTWSADNTYDSDDFASILETHLARAGWAEGQALTVHIINDGSSSNAYRRAKSYDLSDSLCAELRVTYESLEGEVDVGIGFDDEIDAFNLTDELAEGLGFADAIDAFNTSGYLDEGLGIDDAVDGTIESDQDVDVGLGLSDTIDASAEWQAAVDVGLGLSDAIDAFNWSAWLRANAASQVTRFIFTLTGAPDGVADAEIPISSFSARKRSGEATYLSVVAPSYNSSAQIYARANGEMVIEQAYEVAGEIVLRQEILRAALETIRPDQGGVNRAITLTGHQTVSYMAQMITLEKPIYYSFQTEKKVYRFLTIDPWINPGDTCVVDVDSFAVDNVIYFMGPNFSQMEVRE